ncbi:hypothetical protein Trydic_g9864 [Trypoxylus dichotomus]
MFQNNLEEIDGMEAVIFTRERDLPAEVCSVKRALKNLQLKLLVHLTTILNAVLRLLCYPSRQKSLGIISKILQTLLLAEINNHVDELLDNDQFAFRSAHSITSHLFRIMDHATTAFNRIQTIVHLDLEKAFDKIRHERLLLKMKDSGFPTRMLKTVRTYI